MYKKNEGEQILNSPLQWETRKVKVKDLVQLDINPRKISDSRKKKLSESLSKFNLVEIPAVNTDMRIIGGNQRVTALLMAERGDEEIDVRYPNRKLTAKEVKEYAIISNTHAGEFDFEILDLDFADIEIEKWIEMPTIYESKEQIEDKEIKPFRKTHILLSFSPEILSDIEDFIQKIKDTKGVEYEQSSN
jgi:hypothetical protein